MESILDITGERCPMTVVKVKLRLERLSPGGQLTVLLAEGEPLENVPSFLRSQGWQVSVPQPNGAYWSINVGKK